MLAMHSSMLITVGASALESNSAGPLCSSQLAFSLVPTEDSSFSLDPL